MTEEIFYAAVIGLISGFVGAICGGGGLLSIPALILIGIPAQVAIATNQMGNLGFVLTCSYKFSKGKKIVWSYVGILTVLAVIGGVIGSQILLSVNEEYLNQIVATLILLLIPALYINKDFGVKRNEAASTKLKVLGYACYFILAILGGFLGGGVGLIIIYLLMFFFGLTVIEANATDMIPWALLASAVLIVFWIEGIVDVRLGIALTSGMMVGGYYGAHTALKIGEERVKQVFSLACFLIGIKILLWS